MLHLAFALVPALVAPASPQAAVAAVLDDWHRAASMANEEQYFGLMAENCVFLGTDATERWDKAAFRAYAHPHFARGQGWSFKAVHRTIAFAAEGTVAYFDEDLTGSLGPCRGSGILECRNGAWKILQYNLSVPIPNALLDEVQARIASPRTPAASH